MQPETAGGRLGSAAGKSLGQVQQMLCLCVAQVQEVFSAVEQGLELLGTTAVEDRLQDGVSETIVNLRKAGIKVTACRSLDHLKVSRDRLD